MTKIFGILNITPDSFSDGGVNFNIKSALQTIERMMEDGVFAIDIGAESTRPNAMEIGYEEEIKRLQIITGELLKYKTKFSIDTRNFETAKWALGKGFTILNDVSGFMDKKMHPLLNDGYEMGIFTHALTIPVKPQVVMKEEGEELLATLKNWALAKIKEFEDLGINKEKLVFDVGIGIGKTAQQSLFLMQNIEFFKCLGVSVMVGHSRKSFLKLPFAERFKQSEPSVYEKDLMTTIFSLQMLGKVDYLRVHDTAILNKVVM